MTAQVESGTKRKLESSDGVDSRSSKRSKEWHGREVSAGAGAAAVDDRVTLDLLGRFHTDFTSNPNNRLVQNALTRQSLHRLAMDRTRSTRIPHLFSHQIDTLPKATNQRSSGRCWMFAGLNAMRVQMIKDHDLPTDFEFSQTYLFFFQKLEKANTFLNRMIDWADQPLDDDDLSDLLDSPIGDGDYWTTFSALVKKYGVIPKSAMKESHNSKASSLLNRILASLLRQHTLELRRMSEEHATRVELIDKKNEILNIVYRILSDHLGEPPSKFDWEYTGKKDSKYHRVRGLTPMEFYEEYCNYPFDDKVILSNIPLESRPYYQLYQGSSDCSVREEEKEVYLNAPYEKIIPSLIQSIKDGEPIYFYADVRNEINTGKGIMDVALYDYSLVFDTPITMTKGERLLTQESQSNHAMLISGVNLDHGKPNRWCVENSWGKDRGDGGYLTMSHEWFLNYTYAFVVDKKYLPHELRILLDQEPVPLSSKDPT